MTAANRLLILLVGTLLTACGDDSASGSYPAGPFEPVARTRSSVPDDAGKLVPADSQVVVQISDAQKLIDDVKALVAIAKPGLENMVSVGPLLGASGLRERDLDLAGTSVIAMSQTPMGLMPAFVIATKNAEDAADLTEKPATASGNYLGIGMASAPVVGTATPALATNLLSGDVAMRVDLQRVLAPFRAQIDQYLDPQFLAAQDPQFAADPNSLQMLGMMADGLKQFLDAAKQLDVGLSLDGGALVVDAILTTEPTTPIKRVPGKYVAMDLARRLPASDGAMMIVSDADWGALMDTFSGFYDSMAETLPEEQRESFVQLIAQSTELYRAVGSGTVLTMEFGSSLFSGVGLSECKDAAAFSTAYFKLMDDYANSADFGVIFTERTKATIDGVEFTTQGMKFDIAKLMRAQGRELRQGEVERVGQMVEKMIGGEFRFSFGAHEDLLLMVFGDLDAQAEALVAAAKGGTAKPVPGLGAALGELHSSPNVFVTMDVRRFLKGYFGMIRAMLPEPAMWPLPGIPEGSPIPAWFSFTSGATQSEMQMRVDLKGLVELGAALVPK